MHQHHGTNRRRGFLLDHGSPVVPRFLPASSPSFSGGDIYIACPFWDSPFKLLVFLRPHVYDRVDETPYTLTISLRACGKRLKVTGESGYNCNKIGVRQRGACVLVVRCERRIYLEQVRGTRSVNKTVSSREVLGVERKEEREKEEGSERNRQ